MKKVSIILSVLVLILCAFALIPGKIKPLPDNNLEDNNLDIAEVAVEERYPKIEEKAKEALQFCEANDCSTDFCILIDMKIHSGKHRLFIYDFKREASF